MIQFNSGFAAAAIPGVDVTGQTVWARKRRQAPMEPHDEPFLAVRNTGIVLNVVFPNVSFDRLARAALIEHEVLKGDHVPLIAFQSGIAGG